jgi:glycerol-3-phosphate acyltransferase PlsY
MNEVVYYLIIVATSFFVGSIPNGLIIGKWLRGVDVRQFGSKNIGATNVFRVLGPWPALLVLLSDMAKGVVGVFIGNFLLGTPLAQLAGGIAAMAGHNWSLFLGFKGGRGVATGLGAFLILTPKATIIAFVIWAVIVFWTRYVSLGSIIAAAAVPFLVWGFGERTEYLVIAVLAAVFVIVRHKPNIERLLEGKELKIKPGSAAPDKKEQ